MMPPPFPISRPRIGGGPRCFPLVFLVSCIPFFQEAVPRHEGTAAAASAPAAASVTVRAGTSPALVGAKARPSLLSTNPSPSTGPVDTGFLPVFSNDAKVLRHAHTDNQKYPRKGEVQQDALGQKAQYIQVKSEPAASVAAMPAGAAATPPAAAAPPAAASPPAQGGAAPAASILAPAALPAAAAAQAASLPGRPADSAPSASAFAPVSSTPSAPASPAAPAAPAPASAAAAAAPLAGAPALGAETAPAAVPPGAGAAQAAIPAPATAAAPTAPAPAVPSAPEPTASAAAAVAPAAAAPPGPALAAPATPMTAPQALQAPLTAPVEPAQSPAAPASPAPAPTAPTQAEPVASSPATAAAGATAPTGTGAWPSAAVPEGTGALSRAKLTYLLAVPSGAKKGDVSAPGVATESEGIPLPTALTGQELATPLSAPLDTLGGQAVEMPVTAGVAGTEPLVSLRQQYRYYCHTRALFFYFAQTPRFVHSASAIPYVTYLFRVGRKQVSGGFVASARACVTFLQDTKSCFNHCSCTPVMVVAALLFAACCCSVVVAAVMMGNLFSKVRPYQVFGLLSKLERAACVGTQRRMARAKNGRLYIRSWRTSGATRSTVPPLHMFLCLVFRSFSSDRLRACSCGYCDASRGSCLLHFSSAEATRFSLPPSLVREPHP